MNILTSSRPASARPGPRALFASMLCAMLMTACGGGGGGDSEPLPFKPPGSATVDPSAPPSFDAGEIAGISLAASEVGSSTGMLIGYTTGQQADTINSAYIEDQWVYMQQCLAVTNAVPQVVVINGALEALSSEDDVVRYIDGIPIASSNIGAEKVTILVSEFDFDGSLGDPGSYLRSIIGRYLWAAEGLRERDYPFQCARR